MTPRMVLTLLWLAQTLVALAFVFRIVVVIYQNHLRKRFRMVMWASLMGFVGLAAESGYRFIFRAYADYIGSTVTVALDSWWFAVATAIHTLGFIALGAAIELLVYGEKSDRAEDKEVKYG